MLLEKLSVFALVYDDVSQKHKTTMEHKIGDIVVI